VIAACGLALGVSACADPATLAMGGASVVTFAHTGKTLTDHAMSLATEQDCSLKNTIAGKAWCQPLSHTGADDAPADPEFYCYRSIAEVTCYRLRNPHDTATRLTSAPAHAVPTETSPD
jgi:hypothetical protein